MVENAFGNKRHLYLAAAMILLVIAGVALFAHQGRPGYRFLGMLALLASVRCVRAFRTAGVTAQVQDPDRAYQKPDFARLPRPSRLLWGVSIGLAITLLVGIGCLYRDKAHGGHDVWPVYFVAATVLVGAVVWSYLGTLLRK